MKTIIKTPFSNALSLAASLDRLGIPNQSVTLPLDVSADTTHLLFPGVGHAGKMLAFLRDNGWDQFIRETTLPFMGICLGFQVLFDFLEEGECEGLGIFDGRVGKLALKPLPHMGWARERGHPEYYYFVHSFGVATSQAATHYLETDLPVVSRARRKNFYGCQFHPERSSETGARILKEFLCS